MLVEASREAGLIREAQQEAVERIFALGKRRIREIRTPRHEIEWVDIEDDPDRIREEVRACNYAQVVISRATVDEVVGIVRKQDLLDQILDGGTIDLSAVARPPIVVHEAMSVLAVLETFQRKPVQMALVVDEYGSLEGIVTQTDLLGGHRG
jgi:putative hemolysin